MENIKRKFLVLTHNYIIQSKPAVTLYRIHVPLKVNNWSQEITELNYFFANSFPNRVR
jgi:predicted metalloenzyme YecM